MASSQPPNNAVQWEATFEHRYFTITISNYPHLLQRTRDLQELPYDVRFNEF